MPILKTLFSIRLICIVLYVQIVGLFLNFEQYDFQQLAIWAAWIPILMLPYILSKKKWVFISFTTLIFIENLLNLIHLIVVKGPLTVSSLFVIANTNISESADFFGLKMNFYFLLLIPYICLFIFSLLKIPQVIYSRKSIIFFVIIFSYSTIYLTDNIIHERFARKALPVTTKTIVEFQREMKTYKSLKNRKLSKVEANIKDAENGRHVCILVLGESANRNHFGLYGYHRNTTPKFSARDDIFVYSDVITPYSLTLNAVLALYTEATFENKKPVDESVSLLDIFYSVGFNTFWLSNQSPIGIFDNAVFNMAQTAENVKFVNISSNSSFESTLKKSYDELLLSELSKILKDKSQNLFITIHLMGSHSSYSKRYPTKFEHFKGSSDKKQKIIDHYDNSILYTDYVLDSMLNMLTNFSLKSNATVSFIYCSDHGENVCDYNNTVGHDWSGYFPDCLAEIPLIIWLSDNYKKKYPDKIDNILKNKDLPFMSDNLFHLVLDLQNIEISSLDFSKSIVNENYKIPRKRILEDGREYVKQKR